MTNKAVLERKLKRLDFLAKLFYQHDFATIGDEISAIRKDTEVDAFYKVLRYWLL